MKRLVLIGALALLGCSETPSTNVDAADMDTTPDASVDAAGDAGVPDAAAMLDAGPNYASCAPFAELGPLTVGVRAATLGAHEAQIFYPAAAPGVAFEAYDLSDWLPPEDAVLLSAVDAPLFEFPAYRDAAYSTEAAFPVVVFSHGFGGYSLQSSVLLATIASWGFVVVAPEHPERNLTRVLELDGAPMEDFSAQTLLDVVDVLEQESANATELGTLVDVDRLALLGHSAGGFAAMTVGGDPRVDLVISWASGNFNSTAAFAAPSLVMAGENDRLANSGSARQLYDSRTPPRTFAVVDGLGHLGFADICLIGREQGGVLQIAEDAGVNVPQILKVLGKDGCLPQDRPPEEGWPLINAVTIAALDERLRAGEPLDLDATRACFGALVTELISENP